MLYFEFSIKLECVLYFQIFNVDINVEGLLKLTIEGGFNIALYFKSVNAVPEPIYYLLYLMMIAMLMH
jgi:hypothetical protein